MLTAFTAGLMSVFTPMGLLAILGGVLCGIFVGVMPGLSLSLIHIFQAGDDSTVGIGGGTLVQGALIGAVLHGVAGDVLHALPHLSLIHI